jgi:V-type H+-transporting ATPase subunit C
MILKQYEKIGNEIDKRLLDYRTIKRSLEAVDMYERRQNLARMNLSEIVKEAHIIQDSDNLATALVVVPKSRVREWNTTYESLGPYVVPRSSEAIYSDETHTLFGVTIFKKFLDDFKQQVISKQYVYRAFDFKEEQENEKHRAKAEEIRKELDAVHGPLVKWLKTNYSEAFICWIHLKQLRLFVESVLRYGLPVNFTTALLEPLKQTGPGRKALLHAVDGLFADTQDTLSRQKLSAKDMAEFPSLKDMVVSDETLEYSFILFLFNIDVI